MSSTQVVINRNGMFVSHWIICCVLTWFIS